MKVIPRRTWEAYEAEMAEAAERHKAAIEAFRNRERNHMPSMFSTRDQLVIAFLCLAAIVALGWIFVIKPGLDALTGAR